LPENPGKVAIDPGDLNDSELVRRILTSNPKKIMPTPESHLSLSNKEKAVLIKWIKDGAEYKAHWAFEKPEKPRVPSVEAEDWVKNDIDNFVLAKLEAQKLTPQPEADKETLLRRVYLDLTGLPPSIAEIDAFWLINRLMLMKKWWTNYSLHNTMAKNWLPTGWTWLALPILMAIRSIG
jgi:hypothetical protein